MRPYLTLIVTSVCVFLLAAGPSAMDGKATKLIVWSGLVAMAAYVKGSLETPPGKP